MRDTANKEEEIIFWKLVYCTQFLRIIILLRMANAYSFFVVVYYHLLYTKKLKLMNTHNHHNSFIKDLRNCINHSMYKHGMWNVLFWNWIIIYIISLCLSIRLVCKHFFQRNKWLADNYFKKTSRLEQIFHISFFFWENVINERLIY